MGDDIKAEYQRRAEAVAQNLSTNGIDALVAYSAGNAPGPVEYLTGFRLAFGMNDVTYFVFDPRGGVGGKGLIATNVYWEPAGPVPDTYDLVIDRDLLVRVPQSLPPNVRVLGIAGFDFFPARMLDAIRASNPRIEIVNADVLVREVAMLKSEFEVAAVREAARITDIACDRFLQGLAEGVFEQALRMVVDRALLEAGSEELAFRTFVMTGSAVTAGIGFPKPRRLQAGDQITMLCGAQRQGYRVEIGRTSGVGLIDAARVRLMDAAAVMHEAMLGAIGPGQPISRVAEVGLQTAARLGVSDHVWSAPKAAVNFGHGMGCWLSEMPTIATSEPRLFQSGMTLALEARLAAQGIGGAVITETILVTDDGPERLSSIPLRTW